METFKDIIKYLVGLAIVGIVLWVAVEWVSTINKGHGEFWRDMDGDDVEITAIYWEDKERKSHYSHDELWEMDSDLAEDILSYIDDEFLHSEDFWLTKMGYDF